MPIGNVVGNYGAGLQEATNTAAVASARNNKDFVVYKRKKHYFSEVLFYVKYENKSYAVLPVDEIIVIQDEQPEDLMLIGHVYKVRSDESDLTDVQETTGAQKYNVYKLKKTLYVQVPKRESICAPMVKIS